MHAALTWHNFRRVPACLNPVTLGMSVEKITIGANIPAYEIGDKSAPAGIIIQVLQLWEP